MLNLERARLVVGFRRSGTCAKLAAQRCCGNSMALVPQPLRHQRFRRIRQSCCMSSLQLLVCAGRDMTMQDEAKPKPAVRILQMIVVRYV